MLNLLLIVCAVTLSFNLLATEKRTHSGKIIVGDSCECTYSNSSEANRQALRFGLGASGEPGFARYSIQYYLNPDLAFEVFTRDIRDNIDDDEDVEWVVSIANFSSWNAHLKQVHAPWNRRYHERRELFLTRPTRNLSFMK